MKYTYKYSFDLVGQHFSTCLHQKSLSSHTRGDNPN